MGPIPTLRAVDGGGGRLLTAPQVADALGVCRATVYRLVSWGQLPAIRVSNAIRVWQEDLDAFIGRGGSQ